MPHQDQPPGHGSQPPAPDPEPTCRSYLHANAMPAMGAAPAGRLRRVLAGIAAHLCHQLRRDVTEVLPPGPAPALSWGACETGSATRAGFRHYHHAGQVIAAGCLHAIGFDPHAAADDDSYLTATIEPALTTATRDQMRDLLPDLNEHIQASMDDAGTGTATAIRLYQHATLIQAAHVLHHLRDGLGTPNLPPCGPSPPARPPPPARTSPPARPGRKLPRTA
jgi:hypothetical protein